MEAFRSTAHFSTSFSTISFGAEIPAPGALLGGVEAFGLMGLFIGPVVLSVTLVVLEMLRETNLNYTAAR